MNDEYDLFLNDYLNLDHDNFVDKYGKYESDLPTKQDFLEHLVTRNNLDLMIDKNENMLESKKVFLVELEPNKKYKVYSMFRDMEVSEEYFNNLKDAVKEKLYRVIGELQANRR